MFKISVKENFVEHIEHMESFLHTVSKHFYENYKKIEEKII